MSKQTAQENHISKKIISASGTYFCNEQTISWVTQLLGKIRLCTLNRISQQWASKQFGKLRSWERFFAKGKGFLCNEHTNIPRRSHSENYYVCKWDRISLPWANNHPRKTTSWEILFCKWASKHLKKTNSWERLFLQIEENFFAMSKQTSQENHTLRKIFVQRITQIEKKLFATSKQTCQENHADWREVLCHKQANIPR